MEGTLSRRKPVAVEGNGKKWGGGGKPSKALNF